MRSAILFLVCCAVVVPVVAQEADKQGPPMKVTVLNVCTPTEAEQKQISLVLAQISLAPKFAADFEISRGHSTLEQSTSDFVRVRRDLSGGAFMAAQYLFSREGETSRETIVLFSREAKDVTQIALEDKVTSPVKPADLLAANTPVTRISMERFGKPHLVLTRCTDVDQSKYEPLFRTASRIMAEYRVASGARQIVPAEVGRLSLGVGPGYRPPRVKPMKKR